jgi:hypothetical protein
MHRAPDPEARLLVKGRGKEAKLCFLSHLIAKTATASCGYGDHAGSGNGGTQSPGEHNEASLPPSKQFRSKFWRNVDGGALFVPLDYAFPPPATEDP